jgi:hypothetical protein
MKITARLQQGFSAIIALVLIVVFALLGAYMATLVGTQAITSTLSVGGMQGWFAARAGAERAAHAVTIGSGCIDVPPSISPANTGGFVVNLTCNAVSIQENPPPNYNVYQITSTASRGKSGGYRLRVPQNSYISYRRAIAIISKLQHRSC